MRSFSRRGLEVVDPRPKAAESILNSDALAFLLELEETFGPRRRDLLEQRDARQIRLDRGELPDYPRETADLRDAEWTVPAAPADLRDRRVEITGPVERKMMINGLNSGAKVFMADFEDSFAPVWSATLTGQQNLIEAVDRTLRYEEVGGKSYRLHDELATLMVRPRGWHLDEPHVLHAGRPMSASLFDAGLYMIHNSNRLRNRGSAPYFYLPKLEGRAEARLWNDVFNFAEDRIGMPRGTVRATVLIETILAAFEMDEILFELAEHATGLNAGRWDYMFSIIKKFRNRPEFVLPDRAQITMDRPFMRAYTKLLVATCHRRGAHAIGGMSAYVPSRKDPTLNERAFEKVREDKTREAIDGFDGTWVAHPDLVPVALEIFDQALGDKPNQLHTHREDPPARSSELLNVHLWDGRPTVDGLFNDVNVGIRYLSAWLRGNAAVNLNNLMEDTATAEIARAQVWQWARHRVELEDGTIVTPELVGRVVDEELESARTELGPAATEADRRRLGEAASLFLDLAIEEPFAEFLTLRAYPMLEPLQVR